MYKIALLKGDGIGPEVTDQAVKVLKKLATDHHLVFEFEEAIIGGAAIDQKGDPFPKETEAVVTNADAVLLGAVGGPKWDDLEASKRPEKGLLRLRAALGAFANMRPVKLFTGLEDASTLKRDVIDGMNFVIFRELIGGMYFGEPRGIEKLDNGEERGINTEVYETSGIKRIAEVAFQQARTRSKKVTSVDKANVLESSQLWRRVVEEVHKSYPDVELEHQYVDNCAMQLIRNPKQFDVILTSNMFGDILSDEASMLTGSIGMMASASFGPDNVLYEPVHGSAPDIAGQNLANPLATILSAAIMLGSSFELHELASSVERAVEQVLADGYRTADIFEEGCKKVGCDEMGDLVCERIKG